MNSTWKVSTIIWIAVGVGVFFGVIGGILGAIRLDLKYVTPAITGGVAVFLIAMAAPRRSCRTCSTYLPRFRIPKSWRQFAWGGWTCSKCGCEVDKLGRKIG